MTTDGMQHDEAIGAALRAAGREAAGVDWETLRSAINGRVAPDLTVRRVRRRLRVIVPAALAASVALFLLIAPMRERDAPGAPAANGAGVRPLTVEEMFDMEISDRQFRALLRGAADANELLLVAAAERDAP